MKKKINLFEPTTGVDEKYALAQVLKSGFWASGSGSGNVLKFEKNFNKYIGSDYCGTVNNGTSALQIAVSLFDVKHKEILVPSLSFVSTANAALYNNAKPIFVDVDPSTLCIDPEKLKKSISKKTKMILPVHFGGLPSNLKIIGDICKENNIILVEDAAHAVGAKFNGKKIGAHSSAVCFSFHPVKNLAMPNGGAITFNGKNSKKNYELTKIKRWCGISNRNNGKYDISDLGWNAYLNEFSASIGLVQLKKLNIMNEKRQKIAKRYSNEINLENKMPFDKNCSYHLFWVRVKDRNSFRKKMASKGIETGIHYQPIHRMKLYSSTQKLPITDEVGSTIVSLPMHANLSNLDVDRIIKFSNEFSNR